MIHRSMTLATDTDTRTHGHNIANPDERAPAAFNALLTLGLGDAGARPPSEPRAHSVHTRGGFNVSSVLNKFPFAEDRITMTMKTMSTMRTMRTKASGTAARLTSSEPLIRSCLLRTMAVYYLVETSASENI